MKRKSLEWRITITFTLMIIILSLFISATIIASYRTVLDNRSQEVLNDNVERMVSELKENPELVNALISGDDSAMLEEFFLPVDVTLYDVPFEDMMYELRHVFILLPVFVMFTLFFGYYMTGWFLRSINEMYHMAKNTRISGKMEHQFKLPESREEIHELAETISGMFDSSEKQDEAEKQFSSNVSHELRTPVSVILAECDYALEDAKTREDLLQTVASIQEQGYRMKRMIQELFIFTRIQQSSEKYPKQMTDIRQVTETVVEDFQYIADEKNIRIESNMDDISMEANPELFTLMVNNLIQNACKYGKENGRILVGLKADGDRIILSVTDDGMGIMKEDLPYVWERFYRSPGVREQEGAGLGLSIVREIAGYHNGITDVKSEYGKGSTFTVIF